MMVLYYGTCSSCTLEDKQHIVNILTKNNYAMGINTAGAYIIKYFDANPNNIIICEFMRKMNIIHLM
jgi:hypothetical protein